MGFFHSRVVELGRFQRLAGWYNEAEPALGPWKPLDRTLRVCVCVLYCSG